MLDKCVAVAWLTKLAAHSTALLKLALPAIKLLCVASSLANCRQHCQLHSMQSCHARPVCNKLHNELDRNSLLTDIVPIHLMFVMQVGMILIGILILPLQLASSALVNKARSRDSRGRRA